ncbi:MULTISPECIES: lipopolysaccharide assembly protein LapB [Roseobacteraceae]|uniref:tetratricopeptide repeat protein n=1 Tax=Roseobacteraceae TaxID=2854170 RepID=UPI0013BDCDA5|nr:MULTISPECIES: tetratricopeptide repeat protein [unclassified Salipiger]NDV49080.1 tetratricopeptide repeat protein [Salipiger sp. PrR003]NDW31339.1 tetratricopeptide repeat protein [Salipiger sp. PrR007]
MRHPRVLIALLAGLVALSACEKEIDKDAVDREFSGVNAIDGAGLTEIMLTAGDPDEAVAYFSRSAEQDPARIDFQRGLAKSLIRAKRYPEATSAWTQVVAHEGSSNEDRVSLADALIRNNNWERAEQVLDGIPPTHESFQRYRLEAMIADSHQEWQKADSFYEVASGLTTKPASVLNNWGYSKLSRGDYADAEKLFADAIRQDPKLFTAKNNLVLSRGAQGNYALPVMQMTQVERAELLQTLGLAAVKRGDVEIGKGLLRDALETHPQHFEAAARALDALEGTVTN